MTRRFAVAIVVLASLISQAAAGVAYACNLMGVTTGAIEHCCCRSDAAAPTPDESAGGQDCCQTVPQDDFAAPAKLADDHLQLPSPAPLPVPLSVALPAQIPVALWREYRDRDSYGTDLYLRTQRLRI